MQKPYTNPHIIKLKSPQSSKTSSTDFIFMRLSFEEVLCQDN
jgi:hypothetical protein